MSYSKVWRKSQTIVFFLLAPPGPDGWHTHLPVPFWESNFELGFTYLFGHRRRFAAPQLRRICPSALRAALSPTFPHRGRFAAPRLPTFSWRRFAPQTPSPTYLPFWCATCATRKKNQCIAPKSLRRVQGTPILRGLCDIIPSFCGLLMHSYSK